MKQIFHKQLLRSIMLALILVFTPLDAFADREISRQQAIEIVKDQYQGKVLKVDRKKSYFKVKLLTKDGRVKQIKVDARSGDIL